MDNPPEIATLIRACRFKCFRCDSRNWEADGAKKALCTDCRLTGRKAYGIARLKKDEHYFGSVYIYVHADVKSKYGEESHPIALGGTDHWYLMSSKQGDFRGTIEETMNANKIPCPLCGECKKWIGELHHDKDDYKKYAICSTCDNNGTKRKGCGTCPHRTKYVIETFIGKYRERIPCDGGKMRYSFVESNKDGGRWDLVVEDVKDPGYE